MEVQEVSQTVGRIYRLDSTGHGTVITWGESPSEIRDARKTFDTLKGQGFSFFRMEDGQKGAPITEFDPKAGEILAVPRMQGG